RAPAPATGSLRAADKAWTKGERLARLLYETGARPLLQRRRRDPRCSANPSDAFARFWPERTAAQGRGHAKGGERTWPGALVLPAPARNRLRQVRDVRRVHRRLPDPREEHTRPELPRRRRAQGGGRPHAGGGGRHPGGPRRLHGAVS